MSGNNNVIVMVFHDYPQPSGQIRQMILFRLGKRLPMSSALTAALDFYFSPATEGMSINDHRDLLSIAPARASLNGIWHVRSIFRRGSTLWSSAPYSLLSPDVYSKQQQDFLLLFLSLDINALCINISPFYSET